jgi:hypothetical protein
MKMMEEGMYSNALEYFEKAVKLKPDFENG